MTRAVAAMDGERVACPAAGATGSPGPSAHGPGLALPLAEHRLDRVVHLGVLVILGGHQELLNSPKETHVSSDVRERPRRTHSPLDSCAPGPQIIAVHRASAVPWTCRTCGLAGPSRRPVFKQQHPMQG